MRLGLRSRVALTVLLTTLPFGLFVGWVDRVLHRRTVVETVAQEIRARMEQGGQRRCETAPQTFPGRRGRRRRRAPIFAYHGATLDPSSRFTPPIGQHLRTQLQTSPVAYHLEGDHLWVGVRVDEHSRCGVVVVRRPFRQPGLLPLASPVLIALFAGLIGLLAAAPLVSRIRRLQLRVQKQKGHAAGGSVAMNGDDEIAELSRAFEEARRALSVQVVALERRDSALKEYIANTTHDVMLPLTVLQGHLVALQQRSQAAADPNASDRATLDLAIEESHYLASMIHNLSAVARLDAGDQLTFAAVDLADVVQRVVARNAPVASQKRISLEHAVPAEPLSVHGDQTLLERAIGNVVHNAVRHGREGGHIAVVLEPQGQRFVLTVADDGPGVPPAALSKLGERHAKIEPIKSLDASRTRRTRGMGLGLSITKDVAQTHGFELAFANAEPPETGLRVRISGALKAV